MQKLSGTLTFILILISILVLGQKPANEQLFNHALNAPDSVEISFAKLADYLKAPAQNDHEIAEAIFYWVAINVIYHNDPEFELAYTEDIAETTLLTKKSGCEGMARLYRELCTAAGLQCELIFGVARGSGFESGRSSSNHGWNAVFSDGRWNLVDATWGGGGSTDVDGRKVQVRELDMRYFYADPQDFVIDHFPEQKKWQLLDKPVSKKEFYGDFYDLKRMAKHTKYN